MSKRNPNFTGIETENLITLVAENLDIIDCRKSDTISLRKKEECWKTIEEAFNINSVCYRNYKELRKKYENLKAQSRRSLSSEEPPNLSNVINGNNAASAASEASVAAPPPSKKPKHQEVDIRNMKLRALSPKEMQIKESHSDQEDDDDNSIPLYSYNYQNQQTAAFEDLYVYDSNYPAAPQAVINETATNPNLTNHKSNAKSKSSKQTTTKSLKKEKLALETALMKKRHREFVKSKKLERELLLENHEMKKEKHKLEMELLIVELEKKKRELL